MSIQSYKIELTISVCNLSFWKIMCIRIDLAFKNICSSNCILIINMIILNEPPFTWIMWKIADVINRRWP